MICIELYRARIGTGQSVKCSNPPSPSGTMTTLSYFSPSYTSSKISIKKPQAFIILILLIIASLGKVESSRTYYSSPHVQPPAYHHNWFQPKPASSPSPSSQHFSPSNLSSFPFLVSPASHHPWSTSKQWNKIQHSTEGNRNARGPSLQLAYWNKGSCYLGNKRLDVTAAIAKYKPDILGLGEANFKASHNIVDCQQDGFTLHLGPGLDSLGVARVAAYTRDGLVVKRRRDLEGGRVCGPRDVWLQTVAAAGTGRRKRLCACTTRKVACHPGTVGEGAWGEAGNNLHDGS